MSLENMTRGRLIALEGARGPNVTAAAGELLRRAADDVQPGRISQWDASGIFRELRWSEPGTKKPSPRTLVLLYAADLAFRLRREILPALEEGRCVVAAPYVQSAVAFGTAAGLLPRWLVDLFRFAPEPQELYRFREICGETECACKPSEGYLEFCCEVLGPGPRPWDSENLRRRFVEHFDLLVCQRSCQILFLPGRGRSAAGGQPIEILAQPPDRGRV
jgi:hypothetical protein